MHPTLLAPDCASIAGLDAMDIGRHVEGLMRVKALCGPLQPAREQRFNAIIAKARIDSTSADPAARTAALSALDRLSLEICDE